MKEEITREMTIEEILSKFPQKSQKLAQVLTDTGLSCVGCGAATWETLEAGMLSHGYDLKAIEEVLVKLNKVLAEKQDLSSISLTERAAKKYKQILAEEDKKGYGLRFGQSVGGCSGFEYVLDYSEKALSTDAIFSSHGVEIHVEKDLVKDLIGSEIDYVEGLNGAGFKISNPNVKSSCGCGKSQNY